MARFALLDTIGQDKEFVDDNGIFRRLRTLAKAKRDEFPVIEIQCLHVHAVNLIPTKERHALRKELDEIQQRLKYKPAKAYVTKLLELLDIATKRRTLTLVFKP